MCFMSSSLSAAAMPAMMAFLRLPALNSVSCLTMYSGCWPCRIGFAGTPREPSATWQAWQDADSVWPLAGSALNAGCSVAARAGPVTSAATNRRAADFMRRVPWDVVLGCKPEDFTMPHDDCLTCPFGPCCQDGSCLDAHGAISHHRDAARAVASQRIARDRLRRPQ